MATAAAGSDDADDAGDAWEQAVAAERSRSDLLFAEVEKLQGEFTGSNLEKEVAEARDVYTECTVKWTSEGFQDIKACNDRLEEGIRALKGIATKATTASVTSWKGTRLAGMEFDIDVLPPVSESEERALVPGAPHVRASLPLSDNGGLMWGSDLTPFFDDRGDRLIAFIAFLPLGLQVKNVPRPGEAPEWEGDAVVVDVVAKGSEAEVAGIEPGDYVRAVSCMGVGIEPNWFESFLGATAVPMKSVKKVDGLPAQEVLEALASNAQSPDGLSTVTLLLERPP